MQESRHFSADVLTSFDEIGGDPLAGSGFEMEEAEADFQTEGETRIPDRSDR